MKKKKAKRRDTAQKTIPFERMYKDGICKTGNTSYTKMVQFWDVNYELLNEQEKMNLLDQYSQFVNFFDSSISLQLFFKVAIALAEAFGCSVNELPLSMVLSWYEQKAVCILLTLLYLGIKNILLGLSLPVFISPNVLDFLVKNYNIAPISTPEGRVWTQRIIWK